MMNSIKLAVILISAIALSVLILGIVLFFPVHEASEADIKDIISDLYPDSDPEIEHTENCTVCDSSGCETYPSPCWKVTVMIDDGNSSVSMIIDPSGDVKSRKTVPCTEWWCEAEPCRYSYSEEEGGITTLYVNNDCGSSSCDMEHGKCRECEKGSECISVITMTGPSGSVHVFEVLGTGEYAEIDSSENVCRIYSRGAMIYSEAMEADDCKTLMFENTECFGGSCDFVPGFALIES